MKFSYRHVKYGDTIFKFKELGYPDHIFDHIKSVKSFYELDLLKYVDRVLSRKSGKSGIFIDVGANIGNHSVYFGKFLADEVCCFESNPQILDHLKSNLELNNITNKLFSCALGERNGKGKVVYPEGYETNKGMAKIVLDDSGEIEVQSLDSIYKESAYFENKNIRLIKIDVEEMEFEVLKGASELISRCKPHILIEILNEEEKAKIDDFLGGFSYESVSQWAATPMYHYIHNPDTLTLAYINYYKALFNFKRFVRKILPG